MGGPEKVVNYLSLRFIINTEKQGGDRMYKFLRKCISQDIDNASVIFKYIFSIL